MVVPAKPMLGVGVLPFFFSKVPHVSLKCARREQWVLVRWCAHVQTGLVSAGNAAQGARLAALLIHKLSPVSSSRVARVMQSVICTNDSAPSACGAF